MSGISLLADFVRTGRLLGLGIDSSLSQVEETLRLDYVDESDGKSWMRRDYGLVEFNLSGPPWIMTNASLEMHRLAANPELLEEWNNNSEQKFEKYSPWSLLEKEFSQNCMPIDSTEQGGFVEYRFAATRVSVIVVADHEERDDWPGHGDIWSVHLG